MKIALNILPLESGHKVRGAGFYVNRLKKAFEDYFPQNEYIFFSKVTDLKIKPDIIHYPFFDPFFLTLKTEFDFPLVVTIHDLIPFVFPSHFPIGLKGKLKWMIQKNNLKKTSAIITDSMASKKDILKFTGITDDLIRVIPLAPGEEFRKLENVKWKREIINKYSLPENFVLYVGDSTWNKNLPNIIKAVTKCNLPLVIAGKALIQSDIDQKNAWNKSLIEALQLINRNKKIIRIGFVSNEDLNIIYNLASLLVMPSFYEGFGLPILEAMIAGCPVLTAKSGSIPEVAGNAAIYVDPLNPDKIADGITKILDSQDLQQTLIKEGLTQAKKYSWKKTAEQTLKLYEDIIKSY